MISKSTRNLSSPNIFNSLEIELMKQLKSKNLLKNPV